MSFQQLGHAVRGLRQQPAFAAGVIAVLALAIGANTAMFTLVHGVLMRPASLAIVAVALTTAAAVASYLPARRAGNVDPIVALRADNG